MKQGVDKLLHLLLHHTKTATAQLVKQWTNTYTHMYTQTHKHTHAKSQTHTRTSYFSSLHL